MIGQEPQPHFRTESARQHFGASSTGWHWATAWPNTSNPLRRSQALHGVHEKIPRPPSRLHLLLHRNAKCQHPVANRHVICGSRRLLLPNAFRPPPGLRLEDLWPFFPTSRCIKSIPTWIHPSTRLLYTYPLPVTDTALTPQHLSPPPHTSPMFGLGSRRCPGFGCHREFAQATATCSRLQFPLAIAYAITAHKSQGATMDQIVSDIYGRDFSAGLSYVAVSPFRGGLRSTGTGLCSGVRQPHREKLQARTAASCRPSPCHRVPPSVNFLAGRTKKKRISSWV